MIARIRLRGTAFVVLVGMMRAEMLRIALMCLRWPGVDAGHKQRYDGEKGENDAHVPEIADGLGNSHCHCINFFRSGRSPQDNRGAKQANADSDRVPTVRPDPFCDSQPVQRR